MLAQIDGEQPNTSDHKVTFVFGHTHKPFERHQSFDGFAQPVTMFNTGGWVVDTTSVNEMQGAAVVLVDDQANAVSVRLYNQSDDPASYAVRLAPDPTGGPNELHDHLSSSLDLNAEPWTSFSSAVADAVRQRHEALPKIISNAMADPVA